MHLSNTHTKKGLMSDIRDVFELEKGGSEQLLIIARVSEFTWYRSDKNRTAVVDHI